MTDSTTFANTTSFTIQDVLDAVKRIPKCPIAEAMRAAGCDPDKGWVLILPRTMNLELGDYPPRYVRFSTLVDCAVMVRDTFSVIPKSHICL